MKRILGWLCAILLAVVPLLCAAGEESASAEEINPGLAVIYLPGTKDNDVKTSARYIISGLIARWPDRNLLALARTDAGEKVIYHQLNEQNLTKIFGGNTALMGSEALSEDTVNALQSDRPVDLWFVVPGEVLDTFVSNAEIADQFRSFLSGNNKNRIHFVVIGEEFQGLGSDTVLGMLSVEYPDQTIEWIIIRKNFLDTDLNSYLGNEPIHTGDFFLASLFGSPANLTLRSADEGENGIQSNTRMIQLPEDGEILFLLRFKGNENPSLRLKGGQQEDRRFEQTFRIIVPGHEKEEQYFAAYATKLPAGTYSVDLPSGDYILKAYWYPDLSAMNPSMNMGGDTWEREDKIVALTFGRVIDPPEHMHVLFEETVDGSATTEKVPVYNPDNHSWEHDINLQTNIQSVTITPKAVWKMEDGNQIWAWNGTPETRNVNQKPVSVITDAKTEDTLYVTDNKSGKIRGEWSDFFDYNLYDGRNFSIRIDENAQTRGISWKEVNYGEGFELTIAPGKEITTGETTVTLVCADGSETGMILAEYPMVLHWVNTQDILDSIEIPEPAGNLAGKDLVINVQIPKETVDQWNAASYQLGTAFTKPKDLKISVWMEENKDDPQEEELTENENGDLGAETKVKVPEFTAGGEKTVNYKIVSSGDNSTVLKSGSYTVQIQNNAPELKDPLPDRVEIKLDGWPGSYQGEPLISTILGTDQPTELFRDPETSVKSVKISISGVDGLSQDDEPLEEDPWTKDVIGREDSIIAVSPGDHEITLVASDGVNETEIRIQVHVYSGILRIAMFVAGGITLAILLLIIILIIRQIRKPQFNDIQIRCLAGMDDTVMELMNRCKPVSMAHLGKRPITLSDVMILTRQPSLDPEGIAVTDDISILPTKHAELCILFGKKAQEKIGRHEKKEIVPRGNSFRFRIDNTYIQVENVV